jgi:hypothetical protein
VGVCSSALRAKALLPLPPASVSAAGGALAAVKRTLDDLSREVQMRPFPPVRGGGLRGGSFAGRGDELRVRGWSYVPKLSLSGTVDVTTLAGRYAVRGPSAASSGAIRLTGKGVLTGTLGGRSFRTRYERQPLMLFR